MKKLNRRQFIQFAGTSAALFASVPPSALSKPAQYDVIVLGAGLSGLNAALNLEDAGYSVQLLEGSKRIGGRVYTASESEVPGHPELGASGIGSSYARLLYAAKRFGVALEESRPRTEPREKELMYHVRGQGIRIEDWPDHSLNPFQQEKYRKYLLNVAQFMIYRDNPLPKGNLHAWNSSSWSKYDISVYDYLVGQGVSQEAIKLAFGTNMSYGTNPYDLSMLMGYQRDNFVKSLYTGAGAFPRTPLAAAGGNQRIPEAMANGLKSEIVMQQHVRLIRSTTSGVEVTTVNGKRYKAKYCICTLPFSALRHVHVDPYLQGGQAEAVSALPYTPVFQLHLVPTREFWLEDKLPPSMWTDQSPGRLMALKNDPTSPNKITSYIAFVSGEMAKYLDRLTQADATRLILQDLARIRPSTKGALRPVKVWSWNRNPFAGGAYAYWKPGQITRFSVDMRQPWHRVHFAGEHTAVINRGMEGAMESGERAAFEVMDRLG